MDLVGHRYALERRIGRGGTAEVWAATDTVLGRPCAVKRLLAVGEAGAARLRQEALALAALDHRRVVRVYDLGEHGGQPFIAMEYLPGGSLAERLAANGPLPPAEVADRVLEVLDGLEAAHDAGIVHRDIKPHNVLLRDDGTAALCDFGIARHEDRSHTRTGAALGSVDYMSPEQRVDARRAGPAADIYGVGATLYHLLTGETPVDLYLASNQSPRWEGVPAPLRPVVRRATAADPGDRYASVAEFAAELRVVRPALAQLPARPPPSLGTPAPAPTRATTAAENERLVVQTPAQAGVDAHAWGWSKGQVAPGRSSVWIAVAAFAAVWALSFAATRAVEGMGRPAAVAPAPAALDGRWQGSLGDARHPVSVQFVSAGGAVEAEMVVELDGHTMKARWAGAVVGDTVQLTATDGRWDGALDAHGVLRGEVAFGGRGPQAIALVRTGS